MVDLAGIRVTYGRKAALDRLSLGIHADDGVIGLFGPNGAGKSTTAEVICGDIERFDGTAVMPSRHDIAYLPDKPFLYPWLRVCHGVELFTSRYPDFRGEVFEEMLSGSDITSRRRVSSLSKGMSERLHLALVMARRPRLYVLDEPLAGVDPLSRDHLLEIIRRRRADAAPLLLSTHLIHGVDQIFDGVILICEGRTLAQDTAGALRRVGGGDLEAAYKLIVSGKANLP